MRVLEGCKPEKVFYFFEELTKIPRGSGNEFEVSTYLMKFAEDRGLRCRRDSFKNVIIWQDGTKGYESAAPVILQGHMDMVCVKDEDCHLDLEKDPLNLFVDGDTIGAKGTSLGGDDGIAVAMALAILDDETIPHPPLEVVITTDEEVGMTGASGLNASDIKGRMLLNIDSEDEGILTAGCAGGVRMNHAFPLPTSRQSGVCFLATMSGLKGGHSGVEIDKGRGNAALLLVRFLYNLMFTQEVDLGIKVLESGEKDNAIPCVGIVKFIVPADKANLVLSYAKEYQQMLEKEYAQTDAGVCLKLEELPEKEMLATKVLETKKALQLVLAMPNGIQEMSFAVPGLPETSLNLGILRYDIDAQELLFSQALRSSVASKKEALMQKVQSIAALAGAQTNLRGAYPSWEYKNDSPLRELMTRKYRELFAKEMKVDIIHAGLECGILSEKLPGLDAVSIGPDLTDIHTTSERLHIASTQRTFDLVKAVLAELK